jgi:2-polyprenyl-3-methyl-5-hydroxy-6-metoxy-1,4-benzoquinol methylase
MTASSAAAVAAYYDRLSTALTDPSDAYLARYHAIRLGTARDLLQRHGPAGGRLFDFGCGSGEFFDALAGLTYGFAGCDLSPVMAGLASERAGTMMAIGGIEAFEAQRGPFAAVTAINVLPYMSERAERRFFEHARRTLQPDGVVVVSHTNALFDLVSFNRYTVEFFRDHLVPALGLTAERAECAVADLAGLLAHPDLPAADAKGLKSERDALTKRRVDPFTWPGSLAGLGLEVAELRPINAFPLPPLLAQGSDLAMAQLESHDRLSGTLQKIVCSQFQVALRPA